jgi:hypothetical protein
MISPTCLIPGLTGDQNDCTSSKNSTEEAKTIISFSLSTFFIRL